MAYRWIPVCSIILLCGVFSPHCFCFFQAMLVNRWFVFDFDLPYKRAGWWGGKARLSFSLFERVFYETARKLSSFIGLCFLNPFHVIFFFCTSFKRLVFFFFSTRGFSFLFMSGGSLREGNYTWTQKMMVHRWWNAHQFKVDSGSVRTNRRSMKESCALRCVTRFLCACMCGWNEMRWGEVKRNKTCGSWMYTRNWNEQYLCRYMYERRDDFGLPSSRVWILRWL